MAVQGLTNIRKALNTLNPEQVRELAKKPVRISLQAGSEEAYRRMENFLLDDLRPSRRGESLALLTRGNATPSGDAHHITIYDESALTPTGALTFREGSTSALVERILNEHEDAGIALARSFKPFRKPFVDRVIAKTARENVLFSITTALPDIIPSVIELPWAVAEFASDTAFLTMNQVRMAFTIAAASDREVGYLEQKSEIASVIGSAFGWKALAKQVVGKVPFGGGLIGKAAVAYAGTKVLGLSLERLYSVGYAHARGERERLYADAFQQGKKVAVRVVGQIRPDLAERLNSLGSEKPKSGSYTS
jgi:hypothetical protein